MDKTRELYLSLDVETTADVPGIGSMLALGVCAISWNNGASRWDVLSEFYYKLKELPEGVWAPEVTEFWDENPEAAIEAQKDPVDPSIVMKEFQLWLNSLQKAYKRDLVIFANPAAYDFAYLRYYMVRFNGTDMPLGHRCADMRSIVAEKLKIPFKAAGKSVYPQNWSRDGFEHTHVAIEDAREQAFLWARMLDG